ncbi:hypothetical protein [Phenylobacterium sp.]|uniref:hypothetical protein n=1 Tax=Phenylobacterium sp. TaxID=1871053 RepID=UPI0035B047BC
MPILRLVKVQTPALRLRLRAREWRFGAHTFVAVVDDAGRVRRELHGIARGPGGAQLPSLGGVTPFRREVLWGETWPGRSGFFDESFPSAELFAGEAEDVQARLVSAERVAAEVNRRAIRYAWPAFAGANSNSYYATLLAGMGLEDRRAPGELWAPGLRTPLLEPQLLQAFAGTALKTGVARTWPAGEIGAG